MLRVRCEEQWDILQLLENEAKHLKEATAPVHYMIYGHNAEDSAQVSHNLSKVRQISLRLASEVNPAAEGKGHLNDFYHPSNYVQVYRANAMTSRNDNPIFHSDSELIHSRSHSNVFPDILSCNNSDGKELRLNQILPNNMEIISVRLLCSPPGYKAQDFHLDYGQEFNKVYTMFVAITPSKVGNCTEIVEWTDGKVAEQVREIAQQKTTLIAGKDLHFQDDDDNRSKSNVHDIDSDDDMTIVTATPTLVSLTLNEWDVAVVKTSHHFHRRGDTSLSDYTRITLNIDLVDASELQGGSGGGGDVPVVGCDEEGDDEAHGEFVCIDTLRSLQEDRVCCTNIIDNMLEQDITLVGMPF